MTDVNFRRAVALLAFVGGVVIIALIAVRTSTDDLNWTNTANVVSALVALAGIVLTVLTLQRRRGDSQADPDLDLVTRKLAQEVTDHWLTEEQRRNIHDPVVLPVRWHLASATLTDHWSSIRRLRSGESAGPLALSGRVEQIAEIFRRIPSRRLVILGRGGAGKTILVARLALDLLKLRRTDDEPVPVIFNISSWNPATPFNDWLSAQLIQNFNYLEATLKDTGSSRAAALVKERRILPILDGFDEVATGLHREVLRNLNTLQDISLVMTSRVEQYATAVRQTDVLTAAAVVEIEDLTLDDLSDYLPRTVAGPRSGAWDPVLAQLHEKPGDHGCVVLRQVLSTPLAVYLCRVIYSDVPDRNPIDLLKYARSADSAAVEEHLFSELIPSVYRHRSSTGQQWDDADATRWLTFLAQHLRRTNTPDLAWWQLPTAAPTYLAALVVGTLAGIAGAFGLPPRTFIGFGFGIAAALAVGVPLRQWLPYRRSGLPRGLTGGILGGLIGAIPAAIAVGPGPGNSRLGSYIGAGLAIGLAVAPLGRLLPAALGGFAGEVTVTFYEHADAFQLMRANIGPWASLFNGIGLALAAGLAVALNTRHSPAKAPQWSRLGLYAGLAVGLTVGLAVWIQDPSAATLLAWLVIFVLAGYVGALFLEPTPPELATAATPNSVLVDDRSTFRTSGLVFGMALLFGGGVTFGMSTAATAGTLTGLKHGVSVGLTNLVVLGLSFAFIQASWGSFALAHWWLAARGQLPRELMKFLDDAHVSRGILRQVGAVYKFRHDRLLDFLANTSPTVARDDIAGSLPRAYDASPVTTPQSSQHT